MIREAFAEVGTAAGEVPVWLMSLALPDGRVLRQATRSISVEVASRFDDGPYAFDPFLSGVTEFVEEIDIFAVDGSIALTQARIEITTPGTDIGTEQGDWYNISAGIAELSLIWEGQTWEQRIVVLDGATVQTIEFGTEGEPTSFSLESAPPLTSAPIGDDARDLGTDFPSPVDTATADLSTLTGRKYPHVYGAAVGIPGFKVGEVSPGTNRLVLAGHKFARIGASYQIIVYEGGVSKGAFTVGNDTVNGQDYAYVQHATEFRASDGAYTYDAVHGGIADITGSVPALNADGIARRLLQDARIAVDWTGSEPALNRMRDWIMALWTDQEGTAIDILNDRILRHMPVTLLAGGAGVRLFYCDPMSEPIEAELTVGQELIGRLGRMRLSNTDDIRNILTINYGYSAEDREYASALVLDEATSSLCAYSEQVYGEQADDPIECDATNDETTARRILISRASRLALPRRILTYQVAPDAYWLAAGMVVTLTDPDYGIADHRAACVSVNRSMMPFEATFHLVDRTPMSRQ